MTDDNAHFITLEGVGKRFKDVVAAEDVSFSVEKGSLTSLLGPSGCGKTTLLRIMAGLERPDTGRVFMNGRDVTDLPPHERDVMTVFQDYALLPHLNVWDNVALGLRIARRPGARPTRAEVRSRTESALALVGLEGMEKRNVTTLSGGQKQRVGIARALALRPSVLLLDEPFGALDAALRREMQAELARLHREVGMTFVYVTHDRSEALGMSDLAVVMRAGRVVAAGAPAALFERPPDAFTAAFLGGRSLLPCVVAADGALVGGQKIAVDTRGLAVGTRALVAVAPEGVNVTTEPCEGIRGVVTSSEYAGGKYRVRLATGDGEIEGASNVALDVGEEAFARADARAVTLLADDRGTR